MRHAIVAISLIALPHLSCMAAAPPPATAGDPAMHHAHATDARPSGHGATPATTVIPAVPLERPFRLAFDHLVRIGDTGVRLRFAQVVEDSRCPQGVTCIQAGRVRAQLEVVPREGDTQTIELGTDTERATATAAGLTLELRGIEPGARAQGQRLQPEDYAMTLIARRHS